jgi:excisionase family DNA binding protein
MSAAVDLPVPDALLDALADRIADRLAQRQPVASEPASPWLNAEQAAAYLGGAKLSRVYDLIQTGKLTPTRDGRRVVLHRDDLDAYLRGAP